MSYLNLPSLDLADVDKGVISLWFRFSQDSVDKAAPYQSEKSHPEAPDILESTMPLVTFGRKVAAKVYDSQGKTWTQQVPNNPQPLTHSVPQVKEVEGEFFCAPSHVGIICGETPQLVMKFQTGTRAAVAGLTAQIINITWSLDPAGGAYNMHRTIEDTSYIRVAEPESFLIIPTFQVGVDQWHHLLVSFDFSTDVNVVAVEGNVENDEDLRTRTIQSFCKVWLAFDDENKSGKNNIGDNFLSWPRCWVPMDENGIIPQNAENAIFSYTTAPPATDSAGTPLDEDQSGSFGEYHWQATPLPTEGSPMGFPASAEYVETIYHCEMAEFQFFSGVTLDTSEETNRRAFVDFEKDSEGNPTEDEDGNNTLKPVDPKKAEERLGRPPAILLHGAGNWKKGKNTGSIGVDDEGQFEPTGEIKRFKPDPSLTEAPA